MKKFLLAVLFVTVLSYSNQTKAQCNGASVSITNFTAIPNTTSVSYSFDWTYLQGNASIQVVDSCNGVFVGASTCIPRLKDSTAGVHHVTGTFNVACNGVLLVSVLIWTNTDCGGKSCVAASRTINQIGLPVSFKSFNAARNRSSVSLKWETASEQNNSGFAIERNTKGAWA